MKYKIILPLLLFFLFSSLAMADASGTINFSTSNVTGLVTGLTGTTYQAYCNDNSGCKSGDSCFKDYDGVSNTGYYGWCLSSSGTSCAHSDTTSVILTATAGYACTNSSSVLMTCSNGVWTTTDCGFSGKTCSGGSCVTNTTSSSSSSSSSSAATDIASRNVSSVQITAYPSNFNITQGETKSKNITVWNSGTFTLNDTRLIITGIPSNYYSIDPSIYSLIGYNISKNFTVTFSIPSDGVVGNYNITVNATTRNITAYDVEKFSINILPSNATIANINSTYISYVPIITELEKSISDLQAKGIEVSSLNASLNDIKTKLNQTNSSIAAGDYFTAQVLLNSINASISDLKIRIANAVSSPANLTTNATTSGAGFEIKLPELPWLYIGIAVVVVIVIAVLVYLFWPEKEQGYHPTRGWIPKKEDSKQKAILENLKKGKQEKKLDTIIEKLKKGK